ncbi:hypothetical protein [Frondihabitans australicus]|uniref:Uncharacterized protein n=1 Tax=Frondihabitans australicus TaxID=386892 RepID=A0A495IM14_9MICO|nr:hypothetical protein [Frondihabitans australicus]RKR76301.1 hypothetical protein C8E83_3469 [Frondihabitans australicus]
MPTIFFAPSGRHRTLFGDLSVEELTTESGSGETPKQKFVLELASHLTEDGLARLDDAPPGWRWTVTVPENAEVPAPWWREKYGNLHPEELRNAKAIRNADWPDTFTAQVADLGDALERDGYRTLNQAPASWVWVAGGRE